uniref:non-specific serine/threonine protein kinase n=1 Tax=Timema genevievae TaxID=629358 RepID=A0A7R9PGB3_TIMGE|nr:unnamed protein product [Timema genevievae]
MSKKVGAKLEDYEVLGVIGTGTFGTCYKVKKKSSGHLYVWKAIKYGSMKEDKKQLLVSEVNLLSQLKHPNIVRYHDRIIHKESATLYIVMECCEGGDLSLIINKCKRTKCLVTEAFVWHVLYQTARALQACHWHHSATILHRDIKPANVFLDSSGNVKLGDFGLARVLESESGYAHTIVGTPYYMSPEVIKGSKYNRMSDIWSLGCLAYELCTSSPPFTGSNIKELARKILDGRYDRIPDYYSDDLNSFINLLLNTDQEKRPPVEDITHHPSLVSQLATNSFNPKATKSKPCKDSSELNSKVEVNDVLGDMTKRISNIKVKNIRPTSMISKQKVLDVHINEATGVEFKDIWMSRLEALRQKEASLRVKELAILEKERTIDKREKQVLLLDRLAKEKLSRAQVYLHQCRDVRSIVSSTRSSQRFNVIEEDLDTSLSADPGDNSILPTSGRINPGHVYKPPPFQRSASEKRVHFTLPMTKTRNHDKVDNEPVLDNWENRILSMLDMNIPTLEKMEDRKTKAPLTGLPYLPNNEECYTWLENKREAYSQAAKENVLNTLISHNQSSQMKSATSRKPTAKPVPTRKKAGSLVNLR